MIKVKIHNPKEDRNEPTFRVMLMQYNITLERLV